MPKDYLWLNLRELPYFRAMLRAVEARYYEQIDLPAPTLDLGCGDGHFASITFDRKIDVGVDPWQGPVRLAAQSGVYNLTIRGYGNNLPFDDHTFASAFSNSVLEHIPDLEPVLAEVHRVLKPDGVFAFCVPNHNFLPSLSIARFLDRIGARKLANAYRTFFNTICRHYHSDPPEVWQERMQAAGFRIERWWHYFSPQAQQVFEWGHYFGLPSLITHFLFRRWILIPTRWNLSLPLSIVRPFYDGNPEHPQGVCTFYVARSVE
ncbi:MAG: class I SAM-dependent methyltransferase [Chloroflexota bacterium]